MQRRLNFKEIAGKFSKKFLERNGLFGAKKQTGASVSDPARWVKSGIFTPGRRPAFRWRKSGLAKFHNLIISRNARESVHADWLSAH
jgi:hypothetical protein